MRPEPNDDRREAKRMDRFCLMGMAAADEAARDCGLDFSAGDPSRRGVVIGSDSSFSAATHTSRSL